MKRFLLLVLSTTVLSACGGGIELTSKQNKLPVAQNDAIEIPEDTSIVIENLIENDSDADGDRLTVSAFSSPTYGSLSKNDNGTIQYTPDPDFFGDDSFDYSISDGRGGTHSATVAIIVIGVNDAPSAEDRNITFTPDMYAKSIALTELNIVSDVDSSELKYELIDAPQNIEFELTEDGTFTFQPDKGFEGKDKFKFRVSDAEFAAEAEITLDVTHANDAPQAVDDFVKAHRAVQTNITNVLENDIDADGDRLYVISWTQPTSGSVYYDGEEKGQFVYVPTNETLSGIQKFDYTIADGNGGESTASVEIEIESGWGETITHSLFSKWSTQVSDKDGNITLVWTTSNKDGELRLWARSYDNEEKKWLDARNIDRKTGGTITETPEVYIDQKGTVNVIFQQVRNGFNALLTNSKRLHEDWDADPYLLSENTENFTDHTNIIQAKSAIDERGNIGVTWLQNIPELGNNSYKICYIRYETSDSPKDNRWGSARSYKSITQLNDSTIAQGDQTTIAVSNGTIIIAWIEDDTLVVGGKFINTAQYSSLQGEWGENTPISIAKSTGETPTLPHFLVDSNGSIDAFWEEHQGTPLTASKLWSAHFVPTPPPTDQGAVIGNWLPPRQVNNGDFVIPDSLVTLKMKDVDLSDNGNAFIAWGQAIDNSVGSPQSLWAVAKTLDKELAAQSAIAISALSKTGAISDFTLNQSQNFVVPLWIQADTTSNSLWSNRLTLDDKGSLLQTQADTIEFKDGDIASLQIISDEKQNLTALWIQNVISPATEKTTTSVMAQHFKEGNWFLNDASFVSSQTNFILDDLANPSNIHATTTSAGNVIVAWEHENIKSGRPLGEIWTNELDYSGIEPQWGTAKKLNEGSEFDSQLHTLSSDTNDRVIAIWSHFDRVLDQLFVSELIEKELGWAPELKLDVGGQFNTSLLGLNFNADQNPTVTGTNNIPPSETRVLWSIDYR